MKKWKLNVSEPTIIFQGEEGDHGWGKHQFPSLHRTRGGKIRAHWSYGQDFVGSKRVGYDYLSEDEGKTWYPGYEPSDTKLTMKNGRDYIGVKGLYMPKTEELELSKYQPAAVWRDGRCKMYFLDDVKEDPDVIKFKLGTLTLIEYNPETGKEEEFESTLVWPNAPIVSWHTGFTSHLTYNFGNYGNSNIRIEEDGTMYNAIEAVGFDGFADRENAKFPEFEREGTHGDNTVYIFESKDCARTWTLISQVHAYPHLREQSVDYPGCTSAYEGFNEPKIFKLPDGSDMILLRTGMSRTMFVAYSNDKMRTWSEPVKFDDFGTLPQLMTFGCGATLAEYGRPYLHLRMTSDPAGRVWDDPIHIYVSDHEPNYRDRSCFYTSLMPIDDYTCLLMHMDFHYPNERGVGVRSVLIRTLTVTEEE